MKEGIGRGKILGINLFVRSVQKSKPFIAEREELKAREGRKRRIQPIHLEFLKKKNLKPVYNFINFFPGLKISFRCICCSYFI